MRNLHLYPIGSDQVQLVVRSYINEWRVLLGITLGPFCILNMHDLPFLKVHKTTSHGDSHIGYVFILYNVYSVQIHTTMVLKTTFSELLSWYCRYDTKHIVVPFNMNSQMLSPTVLPHHGGWAFLGGMSEKWWECMRVNTPNRVTHDMKSKTNEQCFILCSSDRGRCWRQMIILVSLVKTSINTDWEKAMVNHSFIFTKKTTWMDYIKWLMI